MSEARMEQLLTSSWQLLHARGSRPAQPSPAQWDESEEVDPLEAWRRRRRQQQQPQEPQEQQQQPLVLYGAHAPPLYGAHDTAYGGGDTATSVIEQVRGLCHKEG